MNQITLFSTPTPALLDRAERIRNLVNVVRGSIIEIGRELIAAKAEVAHGNWLDWLDAEFGWSERTARNFMRIAEAFKSARLADFDSLTIDATALYALAAPDVPQPVRDEAVARAEAGEHITKAEADRIIAEAEERFQAELTRIEREAEAKATAEIAKAGKKFDKSRKALEAEIERLTKTGELPGVADIVEGLCRFAGQTKLTPKQFSLVAQTLGQAITDGNRVYQPVSDEAIKQTAISLEISGPMVRALEYFAGAPDPAEVWNACPVAFREAVRRNAKAASVWLKRLQPLLRDEVSDADRS